MTEADAYRDIMDQVARRLPVSEPTPEALAREFIRRWDDSTAGPEELVVWLAELIAAAEKHGREAGLDAAIAAAIADDDDVYFGEPQDPQGRETPTCKAIAAAIARLKEATDGSPWHANRRSPPMPPSDPLIYQCGCTGTASYCPTHGTPPFGHCGRDDEYAV